MVGSSLWLHADSTVCPAGVAIELKHIAYHFQSDDFHLQNIVCHHQNIVQIMLREQALEKIWPIPWAPPPPTLPPHSWARLPLWLATPSAARARWAAVVGRQSHGGRFRCKKGVACLPAIPPA